MFIALDVTIFWTTENLHRHISTVTKQLLLHSRAVQVYNIDKGILILM